ncbi:hypothetical protein CR513_54519, partial [Mucuna pruriens]
RIKNKATCTLKEKQRYILNLQKAKYFSSCALNKNEYNKILDTLKMIHDGTKKVKESKINILTHKYELFKMEEHESVEMFNRFTIIIIDLKSLTKEAKNLATLKLDELFGSLKVYEKEIMDEIMDEIMHRRRKIITPKANTSGRKCEKKHYSDFDDEEDLTL